jgi:hypothetical protein
VGADETFFDLPILVLMELASGFIFTEVKSDTRTYRSWLEKIQSWWQQSEWHCHFLVSDGARALVKLAVSGLDCISVSDLFHAMRALGRPLGSRLARQLGKAEKQVDQLAEKIMHTADEDKRQALEVRLAQASIQQQQSTQNQQIYHQALETISTCVHPFRLEGSQWQLGEALTSALGPPLADLTALPANSNESVAQAIAAFQAQIPDLALGIHAGWLWATQALAAETQDLECQNWVLTAMLPWVYWSQQADKTRQPHLKRRYQQAASDAFDTLFAHPFTNAHG